MNAHDNNKDGLGYFVIPDMIHRTTESGTVAVYHNEYHDDLRSYIGDSKETAIISHVRAASLQFKDLMELEHTHPFQIGKLIVMHNGTLEAKDEKHEIEDMIDSYWYTHRLATIVGKKKLTPMHIKEAMEDFTGKFALLIVDMAQPETLFIAKGRMAYLYKSTIKDSRGRLLANILNTSKQNIQYCPARMYWKAMRGNNLTIEEPVELDDESIYIYDIPSKEMVKTDVEIKEESSVIVHRHHPASDFNRGMMSAYEDDYNWGSDYVSPRDIDKQIDKISDLAFSMKLKFTDINLLFSLVCGSSIMFADKEDVSLFYDFMKELENEHNNRVGKKLANWTIIQQSFYDKYPNGSSVEIYEKTDLAFPWFLQSGSRIKYVSNRIKSGYFNWETTS
jgi:predicted glutamine amidotransferase